MNHVPWQTKVNALKDALSQRPGIKIVPKHTVLSLDSFRHCSGCGGRIVGLPIMVCAGCAPDPAA